MTFDTIPLEEILAAERPRSSPTRAVQKFLSVFEKLFNGTVVVPRTRLLNDDPELSTISSIATALQKKGILNELGRIRIPPDEPQIRMWRALYDGHQAAGGISTSSDVAAATAAVAETLERAIWKSDRSYASVTKHGPQSAFRGSFLAPSRFAGVARSSSELESLNTASFTWISGVSLDTNEKIWIPAQTVSRAFAEQEPDTPRIRPIITTGLATGATRTNALLGGILEIIERDAFIIMWGNQLSLPRIAPEEFARTSPSLTTLLAQCTRYGLTVQFVRLVTDAPAHVIMAVVSDPRELPPITIGMSAHARADTAAEKALLEALRARVNARSRSAKTHKTLEGKHIHGSDRSLFWADPLHVPQLAFLTTGALQTLTKEAWESDSPEAHLQRIVAWCRDAGYTCASVSLTQSRYNVTPWYVEHVVVPELQPMHYNEAFQTFAGKRMREIPTKFGFAPRAEPFTTLPHPFV